MLLFFVSYLLTLLCSLNWLLLVRFVYAYECSFHVVWFMIVEGHEAKDTNGMLNDKGIICICLFRLHQQNSRNLHCISHPIDYGSCKVQRNAAGLPGWIQMSHHRAVLGTHAMVLLTGKAEELSGHCSSSNPHCTADSLQLLHKLFLNGINMYVCKSTKTKSSYYCHCDRFCVSLFPCNTVVLSISP